MFGCEYVDVCVDVSMWMYVWECVDVCGDVCVRRVSPSSGGLGFPRGDNLRRGRSPGPRRQGGGSRTEREWVYPPPTPFSESLTYHSVPYHSSPVRAGGPFDPHERPEDGPYPHPVARREVPSPWVLFRVSSFLPVDSQNALGSRVRQRPNRAGRVEGVEETRAKDENSEPVPVPSGRPSILRYPYRLALCLGHTCRPVNDNGDDDPSAEDGRETRDEDGPPRSPRPTVSNLWFDRTNPFLRQTEKVSSSDH